MRIRDIKLNRIVYGIEFNEQAARVRLPKTSVVPDYWDLTGHLWRSRVLPEARRNKVRCDVINSPSEVSDV